MPSKPRKSKTPQPTLAQLRKRLEQAEGEIEYLKERATRTDWRIRGELKEIWVEFVDAEKRLAEIKDKRLPALAEDLKIHGDLDQKFFYAVDARLAALRHQRAGIFKILKRFKRWATDLGEQQSRMDLEIAKGTDAYYHLYPERLEPDTKFSKQLTKLFPPLPPNYRKKLS